MLAFVLARRASTRAGDDRDDRRRRADAARQLGPPSREGAHNIHQTFGDVEWITIFFFIGLFIVVHGVEVGGLLALLGSGWSTATGGNLMAAGFAMLWASAVLSAIVDNIPFVATMIPLIKTTAPAFGGEQCYRAALVVPVARRLPRRQRNPRSARRPT